MSMMLIPLLVFIAVVALIGGIVLAVGRRPGQSVPSITRLDLLPDGRLRDTFLRKSGGEWVRGHVQEFVAE